MSNLKPFSDIILVRRDKPLDRTASGIILAPGAQEETDQGTVIAAGPGKEYPNGRVVANSIKVGDRVLFSKYANLEFKYEGESLITMHEADVIAILDDESSFAELKEQVA